MSELTKAYYERFAQKYADEHPLGDFWLEKFQRFQSLLPKGKILEIGCGHGRDARLFVNAGYDYVGIDFSSAMIEQAKKHVPTGTFMQMDMYALKFPSESFDGFWAIASLLHIPREDMHGVLKEIHRVIKPGGVGFIVIKEGIGEKIIDERFFAFYQQEEFAHTLEDAGFEVLEKQKDMHDFKPPKNKSIWLTFFVRCKPL